MIDALLFLKKLKELGAGSVTGVPDSLLSKLSACVLETEILPHTIAANEGNAIGLAIGTYLASEKPGVVYMQNSGLGNAVNPLTSLADPDVYGIPLFLIVGWRGEPGIKDEPQHKKQGKVTLGQLDLLEIPYKVISPESEASLILNDVEELWQKMKKESRPVALVVKKKSFSGNWRPSIPQNEATLLREEVLTELVESLPKETFYVATTGKTGRELFEIRERLKEGHRDFLTVGGMGHASSIAFGISQHTEKLVVCLDGDGALLMHTGALSTIGHKSPRNFLHVVLNNESHESVGGQPTLGGEIDLEAIAKGFGYKNYMKVFSQDGLRKALGEFEGSQQTTLLEVKLKQGSRDDLGRPTETPQENKLNVMNYLLSAHNENK